MQVPLEQRSEAALKRLLVQHGVSDVAGCAEKADSAEATAMHTRDGTPRKRKAAETPEQQEAVHWGKFEGVLVSPPARKRRAASSGVAARRVSGGDGSSRDNALVIDDGSSVAASSPPSSSSAPVAPSVAAGSVAVAGAGAAAAAAAGGSDSDSDSDEDELLGVVTVNVVGMRYYTGVVSPNESVLLVREQTNIYDRNAIAVHNVVHDQVGHINREDAAVLAPLVDSGRVRVEGTLPAQKSRAKYKLPIVLALYGDPVDAQTKHKLGLLKPASRKEIEGRVERKRRRSEGDESYGSSAPAPSATSHIVRKLDANADAILGLMLDHAGHPLAPQPADIITLLLDFQRLGLSWMIEREQPRQHTLFWEPVPPARWRNTFTNSVVNALPRDTRGGILADDMGLGKTLQVLSLVVATCAAERGPTLVVCPLTLVSSWEEQAAQHVRAGALNVRAYCGTARAATAAALAECDIVITTYGIVLSEFSERKGSLHSVKWKRVVLDEGHTIKNKKAKTTKAVLALQANCSWVLSGTPIQNRIDELFPLLQFLQYPLLSDPQIWNRHVARPIKKYDVEAFALVKSVLKDICLRRMKEGNVKLPERTAEDIIVSFTPEEEMLYSKLHAAGVAQFQKLVSEDAAMKNFAFILELLLRLRQMCDHPSLVKDQKFEFKPLEQGWNVDRIKAVMSGAIDLENCPVCLQMPTDAVVTKCGHVFCKECLEQALAAHPRCPMCKSSVTMKEAFCVNLDDVLSADEVQKAKTNYGPKIRELLYQLGKIRNADATAKAVVYSQWTTFLSIVQDALTYNYKDSNNNGTF
eukprot:TRINITY_DN5178_c0_g1_i6.p1 TRINITY_DN5178_c0_g1~~TRINITY_DN5178_c0_g1_i6.p1  ORF type:complete len:816 (+),score=189.31 TRINITY_DN5178_c0_g1_i6:22-2448(+)